MYHKTFFKNISIIFFYWYYKYYYKCILENVIPTSSTIGSTIGIDDTVEAVTKKKKSLL